MNETNPQLIKDFSEAEKLSVETNILLLVGYILQHDIFIK